MIQYITNRMYFSTLQTGHHDYHEWILWGSGVTLTFPAHDAKADYYVTVKPGKVLNTQELKKRKKKKK